MGEDLSGILVFGPVVEDHVLYEGLSTMRGTGSGNKIVVAPPGADVVVVVVAAADDE